MNFASLFTKSIGQKVVLGGLGVLGGYRGYQQCRDFTKSPPLLTLVTTPSFTDDIQPKTLTNHGVTSYCHAVPFQMPTFDTYFMNVALFTALYSHPYTFYIPLTYELYKAAVSENK